MEATSEQLNRINDLAFELAARVNRTGAEVIRELLGTRTLVAMGVDRDGHLTERQADACLRILGHWIDQAKARRAGRGIAS